MLYIFNSSISLIINIDIGSTSVIEFINYNISLIFLNFNMYIQILQNKSILFYFISILENMSCVHNCIGNEKSFSSVLLPRQVRQQLIYFKEEKSCDNNIFFKDSPTKIVYLINFHLCQLAHMLRIFFFLLNKNILQLKKEKRNKKRII